MKKEMFSACVALLALATSTVSCQQEAKPEKSLDENLLVYAQKVEGKTLRGVYTTDGREVIPQKYSGFTLEEGFIKAHSDKGTFLFERDGTLINEQPSYMITVYEPYIVFYDSGNTKYYFRETKTFVGPFTNATERNGFLMAENKGNVKVYTSNGVQVVEGEKVIDLFSLADSTHYFVVYQDGKANAFDLEGKLVSALDTSKLAKLPKANWRRGENIQAVSTKNDIKNFSNQAVKAGKKKVRK